jgi:hypothetical protein
MWKTVFSTLDIQLKKSGSGGKAWCLSRFGVLPNFAKRERGAWFELMEAWKGLRYLLYTPIATTYAYVSFSVSFPVVQLVAYPHPPPTPLAVTIMLTHVKIPINIKLIRRTLAGGEGDALQVVACWWKLVNRLVWLLTCCSLAQK